MSMKDSNKGVVSRPSEKEFSANRKTQTMSFEMNKNEKIQNKGTLALNMSREQLLAVADKIFQNETGGSKDKLVHWNAGESFPSLGIGHLSQVEEECLGKVSLIWFLTISQKE